MTNLTVLRRQRGLTQGQLAGLVGLPRQELNRLENGWLRRVRPDAEKRLREIFGPEWDLDSLIREPAPRPEL